MTTTTTLWISVAVGIALFTFTLLLGYLHTTYKWNGNILKWVLLPTLGYGVTLILNSFIQSISCEIGRAHV